MKLDLNMSFKCQSPNVRNIKLKYNYINISQNVIQRFKTETHDYCKLGLQSRVIRKMNGKRVKIQNPYKNVLLSVIFRICKVN